MKRRSKLAEVITAIIWLIAAPAFAHEVLHTVERGKAVAVKAFFADGEALAYGQYEVYSPADLKIPYQKGRTDRGGYLAFVPDISGKWRVKVADDTGHGFDLEVPVDSPRGEATTQSKVDSSLSTAAFVLRLLIGVIIIALIFGVLFYFYRSKRRGRCG